MQVVKYELDPSKGLRLRHTMTHISVSLITVSAIYILTARIMLDRTMS